MFLAIRRPDIVKIYYFTDLIALLAEIYSQMTSTAHQRGSSVVAINDE